MERTRPFPRPLSGRAEGRGLRGRDLKGVVGEEESGEGRLECLGPRQGLAPASRRVIPGGGAGDKAVLEQGLLQSQASERKERPRVRGAEASLGHRVGGVRGRSSHHRPLPKADGFPGGAFTFFQAKLIYEASGL